MCSGYKEERKTVTALQQPHEENREVIGTFLFMEENIEKKKEVLYQMWKRREEKKKNQGTSTIKKTRGAVAKTDPRLPTELN